MAPIRPFTIDIPQASLERLHQKLALTNLPEDIDEAGSEYGVPV